MQFCRTFGKIAHVRFCNFAEPFFFLQISPNRIFKCFLGFYFCYATFGSVFMTLVAFCDLEIVISKSRVPESSWRRLDKQKAEEKAVPDASDVAAAPSGAASDHERQNMVDTRP